MGPIDIDMRGGKGPHSGEAAAGEDAAVRGAAVGDAAVARVAGSQHGIVSAAHLRAVGLSRPAIDRRVAAGRLHVVHRGVYAVGHTALSPLSRDMAAVLACGAEALLSHRSAARIRVLMRWSGALIEVTAPRGRKPKAGIIVHRSRLLHPDDRDVVNGIPATSVARTIVDLADVLRDKQLADVVNEAVINRTFDLDKTQQTLERLRGRRGHHRLKRVLAAYKPEPRFTRSEAERRLLRLCSDHGLPSLLTNVFIGGHELDAYWPDARLGIEVDGRAFHSTPQAFEEDRRRDRHFAAVGIQVVRVTWADLRDAPELARELERIREQRLRERAAA